MAGHCTRKALHSDRPRRVLRSILWQNPTVWCNDQRIGNLGAPQKLYEGKHALEIRGEGLRVPVKFDVNIEKDKLNTLPKPIDLTPALDPAH